MANNNIKRIMMWVAVTGLALTLAGIIWAAATQNNRLDTVRTEQSTMRQKVDEHDTKITKIETAFEYIKQELKEIKREIKGNRKTSNNE